MDDVRRDDEARTRRWTDQPLFWPLVVVMLILLGAALRATSAFAIPIVFAFFVAIAIAPVDFRIREALPRGVRWVGHVASILILIVILGAFFTGIGLAARQVLEKFPGSIENVGRMIDSGSRGQTATSGAGEGQGEAPAQTATEGSQPAPTTGGNTAQGSAGTAGAESRDDRSSGAWGGILGRLQVTKDELGQVLKERGTGFAGAILNRTASFLTSLVLVLFLALFLLIEAPQWRAKVHAVLSNREEEEWLSAIDKTAESVRWFVAVKAGLGALTATLYAGWLAVMGVDLIFVWALVTFLLNFVPTFGSLISGILAAGYAFYQLGFTEAVIVALGLLVIEQVMGNYVEPRYLGRQLALSPLIVLISLILWTWIWGVAGALLATPILILVVVVSAHVGSLRPLAVLLSENGEESVRSIISGDR